MSVHSIFQSFLWKCLDLQVLGNLCEHIMRAAEGGGNFCCPFPCLPYFSFCLFAVPELSNDFPWNCPTIFSSCDSIHSCQLFKYFTVNLDFYRNCPTISWWNCPMITGTVQRISSAFESISCSTIFLKFMIITGTVQRLFTGNVPWFYRNCPTILPNSDSIPPCQLFRYFSASLWILLELSNDCLLELSHDYTGTVHRFYPTLTRFLPASCSGIFLPVFDLYWNCPTIFTGTVPRFYWNCPTIFYSCENPFL